MTKRILFVDDEAEFVQPQIVALRESGYDVVYVSTPQEAIEQLTKQQFDLILLDVIMPFIDDDIEDEMNEYELVETGVKLHQDIRLSRGIVNIPIIFLTVVRDPDVLTNIRQLERRIGWQPRILTKPARTSVVIEEVNRAIQESEGFSKRR